MALLAAPLAAQQFIYNAAALPAQNIWSNGVDFVDIEKDGDLDIVVANGSAYGAGGAQAQHLWLNNGAGTFAAAHAQLNVTNFNAQQVIAEDFDKDGDADLLYSPAGAFPATTQVPRILMNDGTGNFTNESATRLPVTTMSSWGVCAGDVDNDLDLDVVFTDGAQGFAGQPSQAKLYLNNGSGFFTDVTATRFPVDMFNAQDVTMFDWDGDFDVDVIISGKGGGSRLYLNNGAGFFTNNSTPVAAVGTGNTYEIDWGDLDADGDLDGMVQSITGTSEGWSRNNGMAAATNTTFPAPNGNDDNELAGLDFDNDGDLDVFVASLSGQEKLYQNNGGVFVNNNAAIQAMVDSSLDFGFGDLNADGKYDMYTVQGESGNFTDKIYFNNGPADTIRPAFLRKETPGAIGATETIFRATVQDAIQDDGKARNYTVFYSWATYGANPSQGSGTAFHQGGGTWRTTVPTPAGTTGVALQWNARDERNNNSFTGVSVGTIGSFTDMGLGVAGTPGTPVLTGSGIVSAGNSLTFNLSGLLAGAPGALVVGATYSPIPLCGGALVPSLPLNPQFFILADGSGNASKVVTWPSGLPIYTHVFLQGGVLDAGSCAGFALTNGLRVTQL
ncbi:MAG: VCBS repeat-containing protein [Planctomycetota bacterium]|nr:MAG: VCBS repeat-containing protein [Planctomycetota bacterium]